MKICQTNPSNRSMFGSTVWKLQLQLRLRQPWGRTSWILSTFTQWSDHPNPTEPSKLWSWLKDSQKPKIKKVLSHFPKTHLFQKPWTSTEHGVVQHLDFFVSLLLSLFASLLFFVLGVVRRHLLSTHRA